MPKPKEESTVRFIEYVKLYQLLWEKTHPDHKDFNKRSDAWNAIATFCGFENGEMAKKKWKHLTTARAGAQKLVEGNSINGQYSSDYLYASEMSFLDGIKKRKRRRPSDSYPSSFNPLDHDEFPHSSNDFYNDESIDASSSNGRVGNGVAKSNNRIIDLEDHQETDTNEQLLSAIEAAINNSHHHQNNHKVNQEEDTEGLLFGRLIGKRLDKLDARKRAKCQIEIQSLLYKYEFDD